MNKLIVVLPVLLVAYGASACDFKRNWEYRLEWVEWNTTNEDAFNASLRARHIDRQKKSLSGTVTIGTQLDNNYKVDFYLLRSQSGSSQYVFTPYMFTDRPFYVFMNGFYKHQFMEELHRCAGQELFDETTTPVMPHKIVLKECYFKMDCFIGRLDSGFYKLIIRVKGPKVNFVGTAVTRVDRKL